MGLIRDRRKKKNPDKVFLKPRRRVGQTEASKALTDNVQPINAQHCVLMSGDTIYFSAVRYNMYRMLLN